jgi:hypothetical protein
MMTLRFPATPRALAALVLLAVVGVTACGSPTTSPAVTAVPETSASASPAASPSNVATLPVPTASVAPTATAPASAPAPGSAAPSTSVGPSASTSDAPSASLATTERLPVVTCTVTDGAIEGPLPTPIVTALDVAVPAALAGRLAVYGVENEQLIVGPKDWRCTGLVGADASSHVTIVDPEDPTMGIVVDSAPGAPYSGVLDLACPLFPEADQLLRATFGFDCPKHHVPEEQVTMETPEIARFTDPAGVKAVGALSGGSVPVHGALIYHAGPDNLLLAFQISCALPDEDAAICATAIDDWIARIATQYDIAR